ncbi:MAG: leucine-rich repeat domain-containing protein [Paludibacter sp.]
MKKLNLFLFIVLISTSLQAQVSKSVTVAKAGTLGTTALTATELSTVTNLTIIGNLDARDFKIMRDNMPALAVLNMSAVSIKAFTGAYGTIPGRDINTTSYIYSMSYLANEIPENSFYEGKVTPYKSKTSLTSVILPNSITSIASKAFYGCTGLVTLNIPTTITSIGTYAFAGCTGVTALTIGNGATAIGSNAFDGCTGLTSITMGANVISIGSYAFNNCNKLISLNIPNSVTSIGTYAFELCTSITDLTIGTGVTTIGANAFEFCMALTIVTLPDALTTLGGFAFQFCSALTTINIGTKVTALGEGAFANCGSVNVINCQKLVPPTLGLNCFVGVPLTAVVTVPLTSLATYKAATGWKDFLTSIQGDNLHITANIGTGGAVSENSVTLANGANINIVSGTSKTFTLTPATGYEVATLTFDGVDVKLQITANQYTTPAVIATKTLAVTFKKMQYRLSLKSAVSGTMNLAVEYGSTPVIDFTPASGWKVSTVFYNNADVTSAVVNGVYTVPSITANSLLNVAFVSTVSGAPELVNSNTKVYSTQSEIVIEGTSEGERVELYSISGKKVQTVNSQGLRIVLPAQRDAVYLVKTGLKTFKVIL